MKLRVYIGHDQREEAAYAVAEKTARSFGCDTQPLHEERLRLSGMLTRPKDTRGQHWDFVSGAPQSTDFAIARFFVPILAHSGWALFVDCDVVFLADPRELLGMVSDSKAVYVVKNRTIPSPDRKMDGQVQTQYPRKNWSSICLWNCNHKANQRLNLMSLNQWPGRDLHAFGWLADDEIGELPSGWNWLVGLQPKPPEVKIAHFTLGTPNTPGREDSEHAHIWFEAAKRIGDEQHLRAV